MSRPSITWIILGLSAAGLGLLLTSAGAGTWGASTPQAEETMVRIPAGTYQPLYAAPTDTAETPVEAFWLDRHPVTRAEYRAFVESNPSWRRSQVSSLFADSGYLKDWRGELDFGPDSLAHRPVVNVSWFAARAYADWHGTRLPTTAEWERAAAASATREDGMNDPQLRARMLNWYSRPTPNPIPPVGSTMENVWGVWDLHGLVWEWTEDFNTALVTGESRNDSDLDRQLFCGSGSVGAADFEDYAAFLRYAFRSGLDGAYTVSNLGFRTAADQPPQ